MTSKLAVAVAQHQRLIVAGRIRAPRCAVRRARQRAVAMPPTTPTRMATASASGRSARGCRPGATSGQRPGVADVADAAQRLAVGDLELEAAGDRRGDGERPLRAGRRDRRRRCASAPLAAIRSASALRAIRLSIAARGGARLVLAAAAAARRWPARIPLSPSQASAIPIGSSDCGQDEQQLGGGRQPREPLGGGSPCALSHRDRSAELAEQIEEIVGNGFAQRVVIDRAQRAAEVGRALLAPLLVANLRLLRAPAMPGALRLASLLGTQPLVPLARVYARSYKSRSHGATGSEPAACRIGYAPCRRAARQ